MAQSDTRTPAALTRRVPGVALMFEGGGMRASYTCATAIKLLEQGIGFDFVCGLSAGASNTVNFLSRDVWRTRASFVDLVDDPHFGGMRTFLSGKGLFSAHWIYEEAGLPNGPLAYDFASFQASASELAIQAFDRDTGQTIVWHRADTPTLEDLMRRVRASSTLPLAMPPVTIGGATYYDGELGQGGGIPLHLALDAGYTRVFAVLTRPRGYRKDPADRTTNATARLYARYPHVRDALLTRAERYNAELDALEVMERRGDALIVYANDMAVSSSTKDRAALERSYAAGYAQATRELPIWLDWLGLS